MFVADRLIARLVLPLIATVKLLDLLHVKQVTVLVSRLQMQLTLEVSRVVAQLADSCCFTLRLAPLYIRLKAGYYLLQLPFLFLLLDQL